ncbi:MAG: AAA family ATPase, partial [Candidatus Magnetomorum sp.]|nr:AAA family ATPase [Candidatus Magnetomorum sp.]
RFGKSLLHAMLENYYGKRKKGMFASLFGHLKIGKKPTEMRNSYFILKFDFSCVASNGTVQEIKQSLYDHINDAIIKFNYYYKELLPHEISVNPNNAVSSMSSLLSSVQLCDYSVYLLIDEYDNFANELMLTKKQLTENYEDLYTPFVTKDGPLRTVFKAIKSGAGSDGFDKTFITGVSPVVISDITSGYNIADNIYLEEDYNALCGFYEEEVKDALSQIAKECGLEKKLVEDMFYLVRIYFDGYKFSLDAREHVYNPTLVINYLKTCAKKCLPPRDLLDDNLAVDEQKISYIADLAQGKKIVYELVEKNVTVNISKLRKRFGVNDLLSDRTKDNQFIASYLYYVGTLTHFDETIEGELRLKIPNLIMKGLYIDRIKEMLFPEPQNRDAGIEAARQAYTKGNLTPLCTFLENHYFKTLSNRDYIWGNELTVKMAFLALLYNDILYIMDSELEINRTYIDLTMIIRPDKRHFEINDILIEFKYIPLSNAKLTGKEARSLTKKELENLPCMKKELKDAKNQAKGYSQKLNKKYENLTLKTFIVVSLGFDRLCWNEVQ